MSLTFEIYELLASVLIYPDEKVRNNVNQLQDLLIKNYPDAAEVMRDFFEFVKISSLWQWEEIYARTFDVQAITTLDIGYVLFGDDYKRGELLANLNREHRDANNDCGSELADNLSNVLNLLPKMKDAQIRKEMIENLIMPALEKIIKEFEAEHVNLKNKVYKKQFKTSIEQSENYGRIYQKPLMALYKILEKDFNYVKRPDELKTNDFIKSIQTEIEID